MTPLSERLTWLKQLEQQAEDKRIAVIVRRNIILFGICALVLEILLRLCKCRKV